MGGPPQMRMPKFNLFNCLSLTHGVFRINKCEEKIKFELGVPQWGGSSLRAMPKLIVFIHLS